MCVEVRKWITLCVKMVTNNIKFSQNYAGRKIIYFSEQKNNQVINPNYSNAFLSLKSKKDLELLKRALGHVMKDELFRNCGFKITQNFSSGFKY